MKKNKLIIIGATSVILITLITVLIILSIPKEEITYKVTFNSDGGTKINEQIIKEGQTAKKPIDPTKEGYLFIEWTYQDKTYDFSLKVTKDTTLKANWIEQEEDKEIYIVKFNSDGGTTIANQIIEKGNKVEKPVDPTKEKYEFKGWFLNEEEYNFDTIINDNIELKAKWEKKKEANNSNNNNTNNNNNDNTPPKEETKKQYTVTFDSTGGTGVATQTITEGSKVSKPTNPTRTNHIFTNWTLNGNEYNFDSNITSNITLKANWTLYGDINSDGQVNTADTVMIRRYINNMTSFTGIQVKQADVNADGAVDEVDVRIVSKYIVGGYGINGLPYNSGTKYTISYNLDGGILEEPNYKVYAKISLPYKLDNPTKENYVFIGWTGSNGNTPIETLTIPENTTGNLSYKANWVLYGDVSGDGKVDIADTVYINRYLANMIEFTRTQILAADVDVNDSVNERDVEILRNYISKNITKLPHTS